MGAILAHHGLLLPGSGGGGGGATDPYFANVVALLHMDGTNGSTTFTDVTGKVWTAHGTAAISTAQSAFGGASGDFTSGGWITTPSHADFGFGAGDYTVEGFNFYASTTTAFQCVFDNRSASNVGIGIYINDTGNGRNLQVFNNSGLILNAGGFALGTQQHWAVVRQGTTIYAFVAGTSVSTVTDSRTYASSAAPFIGDNYVAPSQPSKSFVDEFRITKGVARYTAIFTPPTAPFPDS